MNSDQRIDLNASFHEKDQVKRLGARFDGVRKVWWTDWANLAANPGLHQWVINPRFKAMALAAREFEQKGQSGATEEARQRPSTPRRSDTEPASPERAQSVGLEKRLAPLAPACDCLTPPWEPCNHAASRGPDSGDRASP